MHSSTAPHLWYKRISDRAALTRQQLTVRIMSSSMDIYLDAATAVCLPHRLREIALARCTAAARRMRLC